MVTKRCKVKRKKERDRERKRRIKEGRKTSMYEERKEEKN